MAVLEAVDRSAGKGRRQASSRPVKGSLVLKVLDFARSTMTFRIDLDRMPPRTLSHQPPFAINNARIQFDCVCRITERATGRVQTIWLGGDCKTEQVGATRDLCSSSPTATSSRSSRTTSSCSIKTFARAGMVAQPHPPGSGAQSDRLRRADRRTPSIAPTWTSSSARASGSMTAQAIVDAVLANDVHRRHPSARHRSL